MVKYDDVKYTKYDEPKDLGDGSGAMIIGECALTKSGGYHQKSRTTIIQVLREADGSIGGVYSLGNGPMWFEPHSPLAQLCEEAMEKAEEES